MTHISLDPAFDALLDTAAPVRRLGGGFTFTEGPIWHPIERHLLFSDIPADTRRRWEPGGQGGQGGAADADSASGTVTKVSQRTHMGNGMTYDAALNLIVCEHATSSLTRTAPDGTRTVLASHLGGKQLNSPNDVVVHSDGSIWFTDPTYGRLPFYGIERAPELGFQGVYRVRAGQDATTDPTLVVDRYRFTQPNGLCFSPDESLLYINDTVQANIRVYEVRADGTLANGRLFASGIRHHVEPGVPDGMKCDARGNVWVTAPGGLWVYAADARLIGKVRLPEQAANLHWGGDGLDTLFITAGTSLLAVDTHISGRREPFMVHSPARLGGSGARAGEALPPNPGARARPQPVAELVLDAARCALIIQDMQNDVVMEGGAFADSGSPAHCRAQGAVANIRRLADACRRLGVPVIHVWFVCEPGHPGLTLNAPLFEGLTEANALVRDTWGAAPVPGLEPQRGDHVVFKSRMSAWEGTSLETVLKSEGRDILIDTGAWTNLSIEHTARTGADKGYTIVVPEDACSSMNADWHNASISYALTNVAAVTRVETVLQGLE